MKRISALIGGAVLGVAILAACGGGGSGSSAPNVPAPPADTSAPQAPQSFSASDAVAIPTPAPGAVTVPVPLPSDAASGASAGAAFPSSASVPPDTTIAATYSATGDAATPTLASSGRRTISAARGTREDNNGIKPVAYLKLQFSADVTLPQAPAFTFVVPGTFSTANGVTYWLALYDPVHVAAGWQKSFEGPGALTPTQTSSGKPATKFDFASNGKPITFVANQTYYLVLIAISPTSATPTPVPSVVPSNPPPENKPAPVVASPTSLQFDSVTSSPQSVTFSEQGFAGLFVLHGSCTGIVNTSGASPTWTITPVGGLGHCYIVGLGDKGATAIVRVNVGPLETPRPSPTPHPSESPEPHPSTSPTMSPTEPPHSPTPKPTTAPTTAPTTPPSATPTPHSSPNPGATTPPPGNI